MDFAHLKALHFIFVITWFAGLFYLPRLFVYIAEARNKQEPDKTILTDQFLVMSKRLMYGIMWPSVILLLVFGGWMMILGGYWSIAWFQIKLILVGCLIVYHIYCQLILNKLLKGIYKHSSQWYRTFNEVPTVFLFAIVFLAIFKNTMNMFEGLFYLFVLIVILMTGIKIYKRTRGR